MSLHFFSKTCLGLFFVVVLGVFCFVCLGFFVVVAGVVFCGARGIRSLNLNF